MKLPRFLNRILRPEEEINKTVQDRVQEELKKARESEVMAMRPDYLLYPGGGIAKKYPTGIGYNTLRDFSTYYPIARAAIEYRKSQITQLAWNIAPVEVNNETVTNENNIKISKEVKKFLKYPNGIHQVSFTDWLKKILEDLLVIDAACVYRRRNRKGDIIGYLPVDAATIELMLKLDGTTPEPPLPAYQQKIGVQEPVTFTTDEMFYSMMNPRTYSPYGLSPLETLILTVTTALKLQSWNLGYLTEGNTPEGFVTLPRDIASSRDQLKEWQEAWDAMLSGNPGFQRKLKFLPEGMKYEATLKPADMTFERFEKWLMLNTLAVFGVPPAALGFTFDVNRASGETSYEAGKERSLFPTALFIKQLMDRIVQQDLGYEEMEFTWTNINPTNRAEEAKVVNTLINSGLMSIDEWRLGEGLSPTGAKDPFIMTPVGPIFVKDLAAQSASGQMPILPYKPVTEQSNQNSQNSGGGAMETPNVPNPAKIDISDEMVRELRRWRKAAINDFKNGKQLRDFKSDIIDFRTRQMIQKNLNKSNSKDQIDRVFAPFVNKEFETINALTKLYDEIDDTIASKAANRVVASA